jgi:magnesium chelatase subunit D
VLHARPGPARDAWLSLLRDLLPADVSLRRVPSGISDERLLGGLDLAATLEAGQPVLSRGVMAEADGQVLVLAMAERMTEAAAGRLSGALDTGEVVVERDGFSARMPFRAGLLAIDEGAEPDERPPAALLDRLAMRIDLEGLPLSALVSAPFTAAQVNEARACRSAVASEDVLHALCGAAVSLGIGSARASLLALRVARAAAALAGRDVTEADAMLAARLVFASRATAVPPEAEGEPEAAPDPEQGEGEPSPDAGPGNVEQDAVLAAVRAVLPPRLLAQLPFRKATGAGLNGGRADARHDSLLRGRPIGSRPGELGRGGRLALVDTLRAAAPWQRLRGATSGRIAVRPSDIRITRFKARSRTTTVFAVDASGSAARNRLAEAKGAVELLLADCYIRRDRVAVIGFRGTGAELLLPPTGSLVRAKRSLAGLPGGGGTPLASGLDAARLLMESLRRAGDAAVLVVLTDGSPNISREGAAGRARAVEDALEAARALRATGCPAVLVDTATRPQAATRQMAEAMAARYVALPYADAAAVSRVLASTVKQ